MIRSDAGRCPVSAQCGILGVAKSTCYWVLEHPEAERADPYEKDVERVWRDSGKVYGARKIRHALGHEGVTLSRRRINRIMKGNGMAGSYSKAAYRPRPARPNDDPAPNILAREFNGYAPRTHLASDPAYVRVGSSWAYVCLCSISCCGLGVVTFCWTSLSVWSLVSVPDGFRRRARAGCVCP